MRVQKMTACSTLNLPQSTAPCVCVCVCVCVKERDLFAYVNFFWFWFLFLYLTAKDSFILPTRATSNWQHYSALPGRHFHEWCHWEGKESSWTTSPHPSPAGTEARAHRQCQHGGPGQSPCYGHCSPVSIYFMEFVFSEAWEAINTFECYLSFSSKELKSFLGFIFLNICSVNTNWIYSLGFFVAEFNYLLFMNGRTKIKIIPPVLELRTGSGLLVPNSRAISIKPYWVRPDLRVLCNWVKVIGFIFSISIGLPFPDSRIQE